MSLNARFGVDVFGILAGAFVVVASVAFSAPLAAWIGFGVFTGLTLLGALGAVFGKRVSTRVGHGVLGLVSLWSLIAALVFTAPALVFANALGVVLVAVIDLTLHELSTERVVHQLEVRTSEPVAKAVA
ncbi:hypothetical protein [Amycolatopsis pithecellobii]|uniref:DUF308 domain-containing protein n=1 Tax=Amycolatopsis pithecellobii TaxID=664692 RepID=A0A6N7ZBI6_9PSEU|nr:hypothetical protein [Amycolatopsis pithecellobii]MTD59045.1 hypothetical protein [Amycolatopsis pithecellobii]